MKNVFSDKMKNKSDQELFDILEKRHQYQFEAIEAVIDELNKRDSISATEPVLSQATYELESLKAKMAAVEKAKSQSQVWHWLPKAHIYDLVGYYSVLAVIFLMFSFPYFNDWYIWPGFLLSAVVPIWQSNIISNEENRRRFHFHSRGIYVLSLTAIFEIRDYLVAGIHIEILPAILLSIFLFAFSGLISLIVYHLSIKLFCDSKYYFIHSLRYFIGISGLLIFIFTIVRESWFNPHHGEKLKWDDTRPLIFDDFKGYPDLFTEYDAAIDSHIEYKFDSDDKLLYLDAVCRKDNTWVNPWDKDSYFLLQHERYHFNITEMVTRMARKQVLDTIKYGSDRRGILKIIKKHREILDSVQTKYDSETDHSLVSDMQSIWQYRIDSTLAELDAYWNSDILKVADTSNSIRYFRNLHVNSHNELQGASRLLAFEENYTDHYQFIYTKDKKLTEVNHYSQGQLTPDSYFKVPIIKIDRSEKEIIWSFYNKNGQPMLCDEGYYQRKMIYFNGGMTITYYDKDSRKTPNNNGIYQAKVKLDKMGRISEKIFLNNYGVQVANNKGRYHLKYFYDKFEHYSKLIENYDREGNPLPGNNGEFQQLYFHDSLGNMTMYAGIDQNGIYLYNNGYAIARYTYNELGWHMATSYWTENNEPAQDENGIAKYTWSMDRYGNSNRISYYNSNNVLKEDENGIATSYYKYDSKNNLLLYADYDSGDVIEFDESGYGKAVYKYDSLNRRTHIINLNGYDHPVQSYNSGAIELLIYDSLNRVVEGRYFAVNNNIDTLSSGATYYKRLFDSRNNVTEVKYFGIDNNLVAVNEDVAIFRYKYDSNNNKIESSYYTVKNQLAYADQGAAINRYKYSDQNLMLARTYYDTLNQLIEFDGNAKIEWQYDERGNEIEIRYYNKYNLLIDSGTAIIKSKYDAKNNKIEKRFYDNQGRGITQEPALVKYKYDEHKNLISISNYTIDGKLTVDQDHIHEYKNKYENNLYAGKSYYDTLGKSTELNGIGRVELENDERGNVIVQLYFNKFNELVGDSTGVAIIQYKYDMYDWIELERYYDSNKKPVLKDGIYAAVRLKRDRSGNVIEKCFYDSDGSLTEDSENVALYIFTYNRNSNVEQEKKYNLREAKRILKDNLIVKFGLE